MIHDFIHRGDESAVRRLLANDPSLVHMRNEDKDTPLHWACWMLQLQTVCLLLEYHSDVNAKGCWGFTALHYAVHEGDSRSIAIVRTLLEKGGDPDSVDNRGLTPPDVAKIEMEEGLSEVLHLLERASKSAPPAQLSTWPEIHKLAYYGDCRSMERLLSANPALVGLRDQDGNTPVHIAAWGKQICVMPLLRSYKANLNAKGYGGRTPLHYAVHEGRPFSAALIGPMLNHGADPNVRDDDGYTPAEWAKEQMKEGLAEVLEELEKPRFPKPWLP